MAIKPERPDEQDAAHIVRIMTGCETGRLDPGGGAQQRSDYRLLGAGGHDIGLLEVTSITDQRREAFFSPRTRHRRYWEVPGLRRLWVVWLRDEQAPLKKLPAVLNNTLIDFEQQGVSHATANPRTYRVPVAKMPGALIDAGVVEAQALSERPDRPGAVVINIMPVTLHYGIDSLTRAIEAVACEDGHRNKLRSQLERRELFVWLNPFSTALSAATTFCFEPFRSEVVPGARPPALPPEVTTVWAAAAPRDPETELALVLWRGDESGWEVLEPPPRPTAPAT